MEEAKAAKAAASKAAPGLVRDLSRVDVLMCEPWSGLPR